MQNHTAAVLSLAFFALAACSKGGDEQSSVEKAADCGGTDLVVTDAWMRQPKPGQTSSAAYVALCNGGDDDALIDVVFEQAAAAEIHQTVMSDEGVASMQPAENIPLPAGQSTSLEPGGAHIMLMGLSGDFDAESSPKIQLQFVNRAPIEVTLEVRDGGGRHH